MLKVVEFVIMSHSEIPWFYLSISVITSSSVNVFTSASFGVTGTVIALIESLAPEPTRQGKTVEF